MIPKLVNDRFIKSLGKQKFIIPNNIGEETIIFDNDFFVLNESLRYTFWTNQIDPITNIRAIGELLYTYYVFCFIMASLVLLVSMIGAILLTMRKRTNVRQQEIFDQVYGNINTKVRYVN
mgnify:CR=1 FL=1